jgi:hypothetical protein
MIFWRKIVIFHTKYPKNFRASLRSAQFFLSVPPLTWNPTSAPGNPNWFWLSLICPLIFLFPKIFKIFSRKRNQPKMKNDSPFTHSTGYLICTSVPAKRAIQIGLRNTPRNLFPNNKHLFYKRSKPGFSVNVALTTPIWLFYIWQLLLGWFYISVGIHAIKILLLMQ